MGAQCLPGKAGLHSDFLSMATSPGCSGPLLHLESATCRGCSLGSMPTLLWGAKLLVAPPQAPGCQLLVPLLKGLEPGGEGEVLQLPPGLRCLCPAPSVPWGIEVPPSALGGQAADPAPGQMQRLRRERTCDLGSYAQSTYGECRAGPGWAQGRQLHPGLPNPSCFLCPH